MLTFMSYLTMYLCKFFIEINVFLVHRIALSAEFSIDAGHFTHQSIQLNKQFTKDITQLKTQFYQLPYIESNEFKSFCLSL